MLFAGAVGIGFVILAELIDSTIRSSKDIIRTIDIIPMTTVPRIQNSTSLAESRKKLLYFYAILSTTIASVAIYVAFNLI